MDSSKSPFDDPDLSGKNESVTGEPSSATAIFGTISAQPVKQEDDDLLRSLLRNESAPSGTASPVQAGTPPAPQAPPWSQAVTPIEPQSSSNLGGFTETFESLKTPPAPPRAPAYTPPKPPPDLANVFTQVSIVKPPLPDPPAPASSPQGGEFTQMLRSLSSAAEQSGREVPPPEPPKLATPAVSPSSFTQMFDAITASPRQDPEPTRAIPIPAASAPSPLKETPASSPGDFTRIFQPSKEPGREQSIVPVAPSAPSAGPGSFTQMFSPRPMEKTPQEDPLKSLRPEPLPESNFQFSGGPPRPQEPMLPAQGGFTQLLQALNNKEESAPANASQPLMSPPPAPIASNPAAGGFTPLLQTLSADSTPRPAAQPPAPTPSFAQPFSPPPVQQTPSAPPSIGGPGEFTRVISGSALRDLQGQSAAPVPPAAVAPVARPGLPPTQFPPAPVFPPAPPMPQMPHAGGAAPPAMPHFQPASFPFPQPPAPPPPPAPAPGKLQQYLPLILILNIFVLLVIVLILLFVLRHK
jgi:hypothetical protein